MSSQRRGHVTDVTSSRGLLKIPQVVTPLQRRGHVTDVTSSRGLVRIPQVVTYVTRLPLPSSPSRTSVSFVNQSSTVTNDRRTSSVVNSAWTPSPLPRRHDDAAPPAAAALASPEPDLDVVDRAEPVVAGGGGGGTARRRPSGIRSTLSCSQLVGAAAAADRRRPTLVSVNSNPALMPRAASGNVDDPPKDGPAPVSRDPRRHAGAW